MEYCQKTDESYNLLTVSLRSILEKQNPEFSLLTEGDYPLLLMNTPLDLVGFSITTDPPQSLFTSGYNSFKQKYHQKHSDWKDKNLSFVVCRADLASDNNAFYNSLEADVYFCRKYVIYFRNNIKEFTTELERLPFLPLPEGQSNGILRPPSAQTLLQNLHLSAKRAYQIVVPFEYSPSHIIDSILDEGDNLPELTAGVKRDEVIQYNAPETTRIKNVSIEAFRAYGKKQEFDVDADIVVLYGPNGLGKTSFFDAIDYVCTGRIGRLCRRRMGQNEFKQLACHLGSKENEGYVSLDINRAKTDHVVRRDVNNWNIMSIDGRRVDRTEGLQFLTSSKRDEQKARIENLVRLFRATHLFSQSDPELFLEFEKESYLAPNIVYRMLALDDYASGLKKTADTLDELRKRINFNKTQIEDIDHKYTGLRAHIDSLPTFENDVQASEQLVTISKQLYSDLQLYVNTEISYSDINQASVREWRAMTESSLLSSQDRLADLQKIEMGFEQFVSNKSTFIEKSNELLRMELEIKDKTIKNNRMEKACDKLKKEVEIVRSSLLEIETRIGSMNQVDNLRASIDKNKINISKLEVELQNLVANCQKNEDTVQKLFSKHDNIRENIFHLDTEIQSRNGRIELLSRIHDNFPNYRRTLMEADKLQQSITSLNALLQVNDKFITENNAAVLLQENDLTTIERELSMLTAEQTRLTSLLDEIETYIQNGICPICGIDHKTKSILIERIHAQKQERPSHVDELFERCNLLSDVIKQSRELTKDKITERTNQNKELEDADIKHAELCVYLTGFEKDLGEAKVILDEHSEEHVEHRLTDEQTTLQPLISSLSNLNQELENTNKTISELQYSITIETSAKNRLQGSINKIEQQNTELMNSIESMGFCSEITTEQIASETGMLLTQKMALVNNIDTLVSQIKAGEPTEQIADLEEKAKQLTVEKQTLEYQNIQYEKGFTQYFGSNNITIEEIKKQKQVAISDVNNLDSLNKRCIAFERIIDATYRSVLFIELDSQSQSLLKEKQTISESYKKLLAIEQYFNKVKGALESETSIGIANHVEAFAPLTTLVQKRLRAVYGFGDVRLKAEKNAIRVFVEWGSRQVKPADYFSDSQKQILMLSIFLSSRLSQTWSGFAPILLDDPVTHFDDLNAFGFIELLRGIASNDPGKRQFFISTCEERLFDLMKSKFHNIEGKAKFYRLKDIDSYGPIIE